MACHGKRHGKHHAYMAATLHAMKKTYEGMKHSLSTQPTSISLDICSVKNVKNTFLELGF
jgi:hypothetical protein